MIPWIFGPEALSGGQIGVSFLGAGVFAFFGLLILMLWVPSYRDMPQTTKKHVQEAYLFFAIAALFLIFGLYFFSALIILLAGFIVYVSWKSVRIMLGKENSH